MIFFGPLSGRSTNGRTGQRTVWWEVERVWHLRQRHTHRFHANPLIEVLTYFERSCDTKLAGGIGMICMHYI